MEVNISGAIDFLAPYKHDDYWSYQLVICRDDLDPTNQIGIKIEFSNKAVNIFGVFKWLGFCVEQADKVFEGYLKKKENNE